MMSRSVCSMPLSPALKIPIHRHPLTSEDVILLRGRAEEVFYDDNGKETAKYTLEPGSEVVAIHAPGGQYHTCRSLMSGTVIMEFKNTRYSLQGTENWSQESE